MEAELWVRRGWSGGQGGLAQPPKPPALPVCHSHVGELEEGIKVDAAVEDVHGAGLGWAHGRSTGLQTERGEMGSARIWSPPKTPKPPPGAEWEPSEWQELGGARAPELSLSSWCKHC